jgi:hypothetical protein
LLFNYRDTHATSFAPEQVGRVTPCAPPVNRDSPGVTEDSPHLNPAAGWPIIRAINPPPILRSVAQSFANRIHQNLARFLFQFVVVAQAVIKKIALPINTLISGDEPFPILNGGLHSRLAWKRNNRVQMIRHKQAHTAMPDESLVVELHSGEHGTASVCAAELVFARRHAIDGDKEPTALGYPLWNCVRQRLADG